MSDEARIEIGIGSDKAASGANAVNRAINSIKNNFLETSAKVFVVEQAIERLWRVGTKGAAFEETLSRLNRQMAGFNSTGQLMVSTLQTITSGTLGVDRAATMASRALATGLDPSQVQTFTQAAMLLKNVMGTELPQAFDEIITAAISGRAAILGNIGVYIDLDEEVKKLAVSTNRTADQITKQEKAMLTAKAITEQLGDATHKLTDGVLSDADRLKQVEARWDDLWTKIGQGAKTAVIGALDWMEKLKKGIEDSISKEMAGRIKMQNAQPGNPNNPLTQEIFGQAIVQDTTGKVNRDRDLFTRKASEFVPTQLPSALQGAQIDAARGRKEQIIAGDLERTKAGLDAAAKLYEMDAQRQLITQEELVNAKGVFRQRELAATGQALSLQLQLENQTYAARTKVGFESTEERITEENRHKDKVIELSQAMLTNVQAFGIASVESTQENEQAKDQATEQSAKRMIEHWKSVYDIQEKLRQQDLEDAQVYYQGEADMANALYAGDEKIAQNERAMLREQLAFKLRLTQEEVDRMLFIRKSGDFTGAMDIAGRGGTQMNKRAIEGILESGTAKDILLAERANGDFFAGWTRGLQKYAQDRDSAFGMSTDMARRAAQGMEQGFQQFFFKGISGQFESFKDVLSGVLDFTKQIISQIAAQMVTIGIIKPGAAAIMGGIGNFFGPSGAEIAAARGANNPSLFGPGFAEGGVGNFGAGTVTTLHGTEGIVPLPDGRSIPVTLRYAGTPTSGAQPAQISIQVVNQVSGAEVGVERQTDSTGKEEILIMIKKATDANIAGGRHDKALGSRFGLTPGRG